MRSDLWRKRGGPPSNKNPNSSFSTSTRHIRARSRSSVEVHGDANLIRDLAHRLHVGGLKHGAAAAVVRVLQADQGRPSAVLVRGITHGSAYRLERYGTVGGIGHGVHGRAAEHRAAADLIME